jgi:hypothetical protein
MHPKQLAEILQACLGRGFQLPLYLCAIGANGAVLVVSYTPHEDQEGLETKVLAEHYPAAGFLVPINMMVSDAAGEATRVVIRGDRWSFADLN